MTTATLTLETGKVFYINNIETTDVSKLVNHYLKSIEPDDVDTLYITHKEFATLGKSVVSDFDPATGTIVHKLNGQRVVLRN